jgi:integrase
MRVSEALALDREDVDLTQGRLIVRDTKFGKSRWVPVHPTTCDALRQYARTRDEIFPKPATPSFFLSEDGTRLISFTISFAMNRSFFRLPTATIPNPNRLRQPADLYLSPDFPFGRVIFRSAGIV